MRYQIKAILYATDLSPHGPEVYRHATSLAERYGARIHILHVVQSRHDVQESALQRQVSREVLDDLSSRQSRAALDELEKRLERFCRDFHDYEDCHVQVASTRVLVGSPAKVILSQADRLDVDCIVLGSRRYSPLGEMVIGSVARKVTMKARRPVFLVPI